MSGDSKRKIKVKAKVFQILANLPPDQAEAQRILDCAREIYLNNVGKPCCPYHIVHQAYQVLAQATEMPGCERQILECARERITDMPATQTPLRLVR